MPDRPPSRRARRPRPALGLRAVLARRLSHLGRLLRGEFAPGSRQVPVSALFSRATLRRFRASVRQEGPAVALLRALAFVARALVGLLLRRRPPAHQYLAAFWRDMSRHGAFHVTAAPGLVTGRRRIAMIGDLNLPQCRKYRVAQPAELWEGQGIAYDFAHCADVPRSVALMQAASHVMFYRTRMDDRQAMYLYEARRLGLPVLYDLDDPLFSVPAYETYRNMAALDPALKAQFLAEAPAYLGAMTLADAVSVSTPGLAAEARRLTPRPVHLRRNFADRETLTAGAAAGQRAARDRPGGFRLAFASGSMGHEMDFAEIAGDVAAFLDAAPDRQLVILGHFDPGHLPEALRPRVERHDFTGYRSYLETLATVDCAVMPLADDLFNRCKSGVRAIDAAAVSVPSLVGTVGDLGVLVEDGITGRVLAPGAGWRAALEELAADPGAARAMGAAARQRLERDWTARAAPPVIDPALLDWVRG